MTARSGLPACLPSNVGESAAWGSAAAGMIEDTVQQEKQREERKNSPVWDSDFLSNFYIKSAG